MEVGLDGQRGRARWAAVCGLSAARVLRRPQLDVQRFTLITVAAAVCGAAWALGSGTSR